jgi:hypothetical protein
LTIKNFIKASIKSFLSFTIYAMDAGSVLQISMLHNAHLSDMMKNLLLVYISVLLSSVLCTEKLKVQYSKLCSKKIIEDCMYREGRVGMLCALLCKSGRWFVR